MSLRGPTVQTTRQEQLSRPEWTGNIQNEERNGKVRLLLKA